MYRLVVACMSCALLISACTDPEEGSTLPPRPTASPSSSPSPNPSAVDAKTTIVALARAYFLEANQAITSGSTARLRESTLHDCFCHAFSDHVDADWRRGTVQSPAFYTVVDVKSPIVHDPTDSGSMTVLLRTNRYVVIDNYGKILADVPANPATQSFRVEMVRNDDVWIISDVVRPVPAARAERICPDPNNPYCSHADVGRG